MEASFRGAALPQCLLSLVAMVMSNLRLGLDMPSKSFTNLLADPDTPTWSGTLGLEGRPVPSKINWYGSTPKALANFSRVESEGAV